MFFLLSSKVLLVHSTILPVKSVKSKQVFAGEIQDFCCFFLHIFAGVFAAFFGWQHPEYCRQNPHAGSLPTFFAGKFHIVAGCIPRFCT